MAKVEILLAYRNWRGQMVEFSTEANARAIADKFGHAQRVDVVADEEGATLVVTTKTRDGDGGAERLMAMFTAAGLQGEVR